MAILTPRSHAHFGVGHLAFRSVILDYPQNLQLLFFKHWFYFKRGEHEGVWIVGQTHHH